MLAISIANDFKGLLANIAIDNAETISLRYGEITRALNQAFRSTESRTDNSLQVGSYGRGTAIKGISDLDMLYLMPASARDQYGTKGQYKLLRDAADAIQERYKTTTVRVDRLVVVVQYVGYKVEVQPVFSEPDGSFTFPDTKGPRWRTTMPRSELTAIAAADSEKNCNLRRLCKIARAWRNKHGVVMGGLLIDTLAYNFLRSTTEYDDKSYLYYDWMVRDFFKYLVDLPSGQDRYNALGSGQHVKVYKPFKKQAQKAYDLTLSAIGAGDESHANARWQKVFGRAYPNAPSTVRASYITEASYQARNTEEYIEDKFPVDIRYSLTIDCEVKQSGFRTIYLRASRALGVPRLPVFTSKSLRFYIDKHSIPEPSVFHVYWKVLNRGPEAVKRDMVRGEIITDDGSHTRVERSQFKGEHIVDCYAVQNNVVVAKDRIHVRIVGEDEA